jgi:hypothetical protein
MTTKFKKMTRDERKRKEYQMATVRTVMNVIGGVGTIIMVTLGVLNFCKLWLNGGY